MVSFNSLHVDDVLVLVERIEVDALHHHVRLVLVLLGLHKRALFDVWNLPDKDMLQGLFCQCQHQNFLKVKREGYFDSEHVLFLVNVDAFQILKVL